MTDLPTFNLPKLTTMTLPEYWEALNKVKLKDFIAAMDSDNKAAIWAIYKHYEDLLYTHPGSSHNHQAWPGGLVDHLAEVCRYAYTDYEVIECGNDPTFGQPLHRFYFDDQAMIAIFCHDAEKFVVYGNKDDPRCAPFLIMAADATSKVEKEKIKWHVLEHWRVKFGLELNEEVINAIKYTHGEGDDYSNTQRVMNPLAVLVGNADRRSARIGFNRGKGLG